MNPLLDTSALPRFQDMSPEHALPAMTELIAQHRQKLAALLENPDLDDFDAFIPPLEELSHELSRVWSPIGHLHGVLGDPAWRDAYNACLSLVTEHHTEVSQNLALQQAFERVSRRLPDNAPADRVKLIEQALRDFRLAGVALPDEQKQQFKETRQELAAAQAQFEQNVQDSTDAWHLHTEDESMLAGLPEQLLERAVSQALDRGRQGWWLSLDYPTYHAVMMHAENRELRKTFYKSWSTRASEHANDSSWDNAEIIEKILALRHRLASLVGFDNYAQYSLATKMAGTTDEVLQFLGELAGRTRDAAEGELAALQELANDDLGNEPLAAWDTAYYLEKLKHARYEVSDEILRQYFPVDRVRDGMFELAGKLYNVTLSVNEGVAAWHESVRYYEVRNSHGEPIGGFYTDLFARSGKRNGAWIDECIVRKNLSGESVLPVGYLVCNFAPPDSSGVSLLTHNDVVTLFHEFGHMLHHLLTRVDYPSIAGINGVPWDAVELPSQFMENFAWTYDVLKEASGHYSTGEPLPETLFDKLNKSRYCGAALAMLRQLEFAVYDFRIHEGFDPDNGARVLPLLDEVRRDIAVVSHAEFNRFPMSFSHIFSGGYAAGYYSYKWAEVLAADAFSAFEESGIFDTETAGRFRAEILEIGGSRDIMQAFVAFRGRKPKLDALLRHSGIGMAA